MADNYLEKKFAEMEERRASLNAKEQRRRQAAYKKRMEAYRKKLEEQKKAQEAEQQLLGEERRMEYEQKLGAEGLTARMDGVTIRPARKEDAAAVADYILMAFPVDGLTGRGRGISLQELKRVLEAVVQMDDAIYGWRNVLVAEANGSSSVVGAIIAYDGARLHELRKPVEDLLEQYIGPEAHNWDDETSGGEFYLDSLAVNPECRGLNIGSKLIEAACHKATELGHTKVGLLVDLENPRAEKLYSRLGFETVGHTPFMQHTYKHMQRDYCLSKNARASTTTCSTLSQK